MAISYVGGKTGGFVGSVTVGATPALNSGLTGGSDSAVSAGDLVIVTVGYGTNSGTPSPAIVTPSGYTALTVQRENTDTYDTSHQVCYKFMPSTPDTSVTIPPSTNSSWAGTYTVQVFRGVDQTTPLDVSTVYATGTNTAQANPPSITPVTAGAWIVAMASGAEASVLSTYTSSDLTNFLTSANADTIDSVTGAGYYSSWVSGAFDPAQFSGATASANASWCATTLALRPAPSAVFPRFNNYQFVKSANAGIINVTEATFGGAIN